MIPIRNTYYMLAYAFQVLRQQGYRDIATEEFASTAELLAEILIRGVLNSAPAVGVQLRRVFARHTDEPDHQSDVHSPVAVKDLEASEERIAQTTPLFRGGFGYRTRCGQLAYAF